MYNKYRIHKLHRHFNVVPRSKQYMYFHWNFPAKRLFCALKGRNSNKNVTKRIILNQIGNEQIIDVLDLHLTMQSVHMTTTNVCDFTCHFRYNNDIKLLTYLPSFYSSCVTCVASFFGLYKYRFSFSCPWVTIFLHSR